MVQSELDWTQIGALITFGLVVVVALVMLVQSILNFQDLRRRINEYKYNNNKHVKENDPR